MNFQFNKFLLPFLLFIGLQIAIFVIFPVEEKSTTSVYDYTIHADRPDTKKNYTGVLLSSLVTIGIILWLTSQEIEEEVSLLRDFGMVMHDPNCSKTLTRNNISPKNPYQEYYIGEHPSLGYINLAQVEDNDGMDVWALYVRNDNYKTSNVHQRVKNPIQAISHEFTIVEMAYQFMKPSMRKNDISSLKDLYRMAKDPNKPKPVREAAKELAENSVNEGENENE